MIKTRIDRIVQHKYLVNFSSKIAHLFSGQIVVEVLSVISSILITRQIGPENSGMLNTIIAYSSLFTYLSLNGTTKVLVREGAKNTSHLPKIFREVTETKNIFVFCTIIFSNFVVWVFDLYQLPVKLLISVFSLNHLIEIYNSSILSILQAERKIKEFSFYLIFKKLFYVLFGVIIVFFGGAVIELLILTMLNGVFALIYGWYRINQIRKYEITLKFKFHKSVFYPSVNFTLIYFFGFLQTRIDLLMIPWLGGNLKDVGIYSVAYVLVDKVNIIRSAVSQVIFPELSHILSERKAFRISTIFKYTVLISLGAGFVAGLLYVLSDTLILALYGIKFIDSVDIFKVLIFNIIAGFSSVLFTNLVLAASQEVSMLFFSIITPTINILLNIFLYSNFGIIGIAYSTVITFSVMTVLYFFYSVYILKRAGILKIE